MELGIVLGGLESSKPNEILGNTGKSPGNSLEIQKKTIT